MSAARSTRSRNRPNSVDAFVKLGETTYVKGEVSHTGREHKDIVLDTWHIAIPNTATKSFQVSGDID